MLSRHDDFPVHQTQAPLAKPATTDRNFYDRYWFNGFQREGGFYFGAALGLYPNRRVMDAAFSFVKDGCGTPSRLAPRARRPERDAGGPLRWRWCSRCASCGSSSSRTRRASPPSCASGAPCLGGARADAARPPGRDGHHALHPVRQLGRLAGGRRPTHPRSTRRKCWHPRPLLGIRPVGEPAAGRPAGEPQIFFFWAPLQFGDRCAHAATFENADGQAFDNFAWIAPRHASLEAVPGVLDAGAERLLGVRHSIDWRPGTRWAQRRARLLCASGPRSASSEPLLRFQMLGIGYGHPSGATAKATREAAS
jgi:hypothetical protein